MRTIPYTSNDLRRIATRIDKVIGAVGDTDLEDYDWRWGLKVAIFDDDGQVVGHIKPTDDGWLGFYPVEVSE